MVLNGLTIAIVGMAIVFAFLIILVLLMNFLFSFVKRFFPKSLQPPPETANQRSAAGKPTSAKQTGDLAAVAAAIAKAHILTHYRG